FRDLAPFEKAETATYCIVAVNAQGVGQPSALTAVTRTAPPSAPELSRQVPALLKKAADDKVVKGKAASPYRGTFYEPNWFDPAFLAKTFNDYATQEKEAFARWKANDQADFEEFLKNDHP
ncbi:MAG: hypothetical protein WCL21_19795, partial [Mariniphaga sp.]